jgi:arginyl-tRNA synthetase
MEMIENLIARKSAEAIKELFQVDVAIEEFQVEKTNKIYQGDYTLVVFPLLKYSKKAPQMTAIEIGDYFMDHFDEVETIEVVKGFLNISLKESYWKQFFEKQFNNDSFGIREKVDGPPTIVEYSSPNTNKPLHLGHIRNNLLGFSISEILKANGKNVVKINLINDRGIHICKSMLAWQKWGEGENPESSGLKGDHLIGKYYVLFDQKHKEEIAELVHRGNTEDDAFNKAPLMLEAQEMLRKWESADEEVLEIWRLMNSWVYEGFNETYKRLGVDFDKTNYESITYLQGKDIIKEGLEKNQLNKEADGSVWIDLTSEGLDKKLLLRSDGTSVYMTQDIGTAQRRWDEFQPSELLYVVGNEQIYHFDVLKKVLNRLGRDWSDRIHHLSYGMVELPHGRMKSREGTVVDADDLMDEMYNTAKKTTEELGKATDFSEAELDELYNKVSLGALKYFILKVDPKKNMLFNPEESIDFNGNTGPFIQYTYARIQSLLRKSEKTKAQLIKGLNLKKINLTEEEKKLLQSLYEFPQIVAVAGELYSPAVVANYCFDMVKEFNHYYQDTPILKQVDEETSAFRLLLSNFAGTVIKNAMQLLGIQVPERM